MPLIWISRIGHGIRRRNIAALFGALAFVGCAEIGSAGRSEVSSFYRPSLVNYATRTGSFAMVVHGNPFGLSAGETFEAVRSATTLPAWAGDAEIIDARDSGGLRLVVVFNPSNSNLTARQVCGDLNEVLTDPPDGDLRALASFCRAAEWITNASARGPRPTSPQDPALHEFMGRLVSNALPFHYQSGPSFEF